MSCVLRPRLRAAARTTSASPPAPDCCRVLCPGELPLQKGARRSVLKANARGSPNTGSTPSTPLATSVGKSLSAGTSGGVTSDGRAGSTTLSATATGESNSSARGAQGNAVTTVKSLGGDTCSFESEEDDGLCMVPQAASPRALWQGHVGPVARICSCSQPPCFFSLGEVRCFRVCFLKYSTLSRLHGCHPCQLQAFRSCCAQCSLLLGRSIRSISNCYWGSRVGDCIYTKGFQDILHQGWKQRATVGAYIPSTPTASAIPQ